MSHRAHTPVAPVSMSDSYNNYLQPHRRLQEPLEKEAFLCPASNTATRPSAEIDHREQRSTRPRRASIFVAWPALNLQDLRTSDLSSRSEGSYSEEYLESAPLIVYGDLSPTTPPEEFGGENILRAKVDVCFPVDDGFSD
ncbi:hypothetical protein RUND412_011632 [Rhizina undulata]